MHIELTRTTLVLILIAGVAIGLTVGHVIANGHAPFLIDAMFVALMVWKPGVYSILLSLAQYGARRSPFVASSLVGLWETMPAWFLLVVLPGAVRAMPVASPERPVVGKTIVVKPPKGH